MSEIIARVTKTEESEVGSLVELSNGEKTFTGRVAQVSENEFLVDWEDGARTVENKSDYELLVTAAENPAQPAGWAVAPADANAYPNGELMDLEMQKRNETAGWEDAQNRAPIDGENPAQPAGFAVPPASGAPIPGQGSDGLVMAASVVADDEEGNNGVVTLTSGNSKVSGRVLASDDSSFIVEWEDERRTVESKGDYELIIRNASYGSSADTEAYKSDYIMDHEVTMGTDGAHVCNLCGTASKDARSAYDHFKSEHDATYPWEDVPGNDDRD